jgi:RimJ/RimL family protein N-acetyltransferase
MKGGSHPATYFLKTKRIGFRICYRDWGRGYDLEAACAAVRYAFDSIRVAGLFAGHHPENEASRRLLAKLGFQYSHDEFYQPTGLNHPSCLMSADDYLKYGNDCH